jgi:hypothetical protein
MWALVALPNPLPALALFSFARQENRKNWPVLFFLSDMSQNGNQ